MMTKTEKREREGERVGRRERIIREHSPSAERHLELVGPDIPGPWAPGGSMLRRMHDALDWVRPLLVNKAPFSLWTPEAQHAYDWLWDAAWDTTTPKVFARGIKRFLNTGRI